MRQWTSLGKIIISFSAIILISPISSSLVLWQETVSSAWASNTSAFPNQNIIRANPSNYLSLLSTLTSGDTLLLDPGIYDQNGLPVFNLNGTQDKPIIISGQDGGTRPQILGHSNQNTVRIDGSSYVIICNLEVNPRNLGGDGVNAQGISHHITLENLYIHGFSDDQGTVGISTNRSPVWNWTIRNNIITDGGTGMYLGNSPGTEPFVNGVIENNLITDTIGYNIEIKHQNPRPNVPGMPTGKSKTIIRNNVFSKANNASSGGRARPNLLVGHFPLSGPGQDDVYEIYGNFFYQNPNEALFQGEGNVAVFSNIFVNTLDSPYPAMNIRPHNDRPRMVRVFNNTMISKNTGITVSGGYPEFQQKVLGNVVFAGTPIQASDVLDNITDVFAAAGNYLVNPFASPGQLDLYPRPGKVTGVPITTDSFNGQFTDWNLDFNGTLRDFRFRGSYAGEGQNPGWLPKLERKPFKQQTPGPDTSPPAAPTNLNLTILST
ncbi:hypothetical protein [Candidatus Nitrospira neomarina]|uniref:Right handed beta helix domain-containing protein n=1 Tax=Candidatus Nitrospira neomarina TaxID=3020899 RepID=A0AA96GTU5_9BACT|nr:hypothetical protein [Candidatus Nitrospira neomarina]WNM63964.1 hypothetical protein PQG83_09450 [Candidatus Nitrospira neomarina]